MQKGLIKMWPIVALVIVLLCFTKYNCADDDDVIPVIHIHVNENYKCRSGTTSKLILNKKFKFKVSSAVKLDSFQCKYGIEWRPEKEFYVHTLEMDLWTNELFNEVWDCKFYLRKLNSIPGGGTYRGLDEIDCRINIRDLDKEYERFAAHSHAGTDTNWVLVGVSILLVSILGSIALIAGVRYMVRLYGSDPEIENVQLGAPRACDHGAVDCKGGCEGTKAKVKK